MGAALTWTVNQPFKLFSLIFRWNMYLNERYRLKIGRTICMHGSWHADMVAMSMGTVARHASKYQGHVIVDIRRAKRGLSSTSPKYLFLSSCRSLITISLFFHSLFQIEEGKPSANSRLRFGILPFAEQFFSISPRATVERDPSFIFW